MEKTSLPIAFKVRIQHQDFLKADSYNSANCPLAFALRRMFPHLDKDWKEDTLGFNYEIRPYGPIAFIIDGEKYLFDINSWGDGVYSNFHIDKLIAAAKEGTKVMGIDVTLVHKDHVASLTFHPVFDNSKTIQSQNKTENKMNTILVVYSNKVVKGDALRKMKKYSFNTEDNVKVGDFITSPSYTTNMLVVDVLDKSYKYYNSVNGLLTSEKNSTNCETLKTLKIRQDEEEVVYGTLHSSESFTVQI